MEQRLPADLSVVATHRTRLGKRLAPYLLTLPGGVWLLIFFVAPFFTVVSLSLQTGQLPVFHQTWNLAIYPQAVRTYGSYFWRSFEYAGIAYNCLPFTALPLYVSLEKIDRSVIEAARDLYSSNVRVFLNVILPLSIPGIFASFLLTFVPGVGDYVEASILGGTHNTMIGNIIQLQFLDNFNYPLASALSVILMGVLIVGIIAYGRVLGTRSIEEYV